MLLWWHVHVSEWINTIVAWMSRNSLLETGDGIWSLRDCNGTRTHKSLVCKRTLNHLTKWLKFRIGTKCLWVRVPLQSVTGVFLFFCNFTFSIWHYVSFSSCTVFAILTLLNQPPGCENKLTLYGESQNEHCKKSSAQNFPKIECVSGVWDVRFRKIWCALFFCNTGFEIRPFALLPTTLEVYLQTCQTPIMIFEKRVYGFKLLTIFERKLLDRCLI